MNLIKLIKYGKYRNYHQTSSLENVSSIDNDYLEAATRGVLKDFVRFTGKHLCWSLFLIKLQACKSIEKRLKHWCFPLHVSKFLRTPILITLLFSNLFVSDVFSQFFVNTKYIHKYVSLNKTLTKLCTILTKCFFPYLNPTSYLKRW